MCDPLDLQFVRTRQIRRSNLEPRFGIPVEFLVLFFFHFLFPMSFLLSTYITSKLVRSRLDLLIPVVYFQTIGEDCVDAYVTGKLLESKESKRLFHVSSAGFF